MKILVVKDRNVLSSKFALEFTNSLTGKGHEVVFACNSAKRVGRGGAFAPSVRFINLDAPPCNFLRRLRTRLKLAFLAYRRLIRIERPDLIVTFFLRDLMNVTAGRPVGVPIVHMFHGDPGRVLDDVNREMLLKRIFCNGALRQVTAFQVLMPSFESIIKARFPGVPVFTIPNAVHPVPEALRADLNAEKKRIIYIARVEEAGKRQHLAVEAFGKIARDFPEWKLDLWGSLKHTGYSRRLREMAERAGIGERIILHGHCSDVTAAYRNADFQVFPSAHEGFGLTLMEGMACGLPAIGCRETCAVNELIVSNENGFLVGDTDEMAARMRDLMTDPALRRRLGENAILSAARYTPEIVAEAWDARLREVVDA